MTYTIRFSTQIDWKRFSRLPKDQKVRIQGAIRQKLATDPHQFGKPLHNSPSSCRSLRIGDYRVIYRIEKRTVDIVLIGHRSTIYDEVEGML